MKNSTAILIGFLMVSVAIVCGPMIQRLFITPAKAQVASTLDVQNMDQTIETGFTNVVTAIQGISACQN